MLRVPRKALLPLINKQCRNAQISPTLPRIGASIYAGFHSSAAIRNGGHVSPIKAFADSIKRQVQENKEFKDNMKLLEDKGSKISDSEAMKRAKQATSASADVVKKAASAVGSSVGEGISKVADTAAVKATGRAVKTTAKLVGTAASTATAPIRNTEAYKHLEKNVKDYVDDASSVYGGYRTKEDRRKSRILSQQKRARSFAEYKNLKASQENEEAGSNIVLHKDSKWKESWAKFKETSPMMQGIFRAQKSYEESENPVIEATRAVTTKVRNIFGFFFDETESAQALRQIRDTIDPSFKLDKFLHECREFIIPEIMDAYLSGDAETLKHWCSEASYNVLSAVIKAQAKQGIVSDCNILDLRHVDFHSARVLDNEVPVIVIVFQTQENNVFRDKVTKKIVQGDENVIESCHYVSIFTKVPENADDPITGGWKMIDLAKQFSRPTW
ncbi:protein translocase subunit [Mycoemilia scoparia]|uniref:Mitochondrial import inner membrane translocase subunit TIM44 n=1 Tax=Mycoemilia scoparia TaxID=417184 RepID=A0A9W8DQR9_9FUNG|nr:protein translocase subunit [Mycoemilia scoparia]